MSIAAYGFAIAGLISPYFAVADEACTKTVGIAHHYAFHTTFHYDKNGAEVLDGIELSALCETLTPATVDELMHTAIAQTAGDWTSPPPLGCKLQAVEIELDENNQPRHWLVTHAAADDCPQDIKRDGKPFWLVEEKQGDYQVLLAYSGDGVTIETDKQSGYNLVTTIEPLPDGESAVITWRYDEGKAEYVYTKSACTNITRMDTDGSNYVENCSTNTRWH